MTETKPLAKRSLKDCPTNNRLNSALIGTTCITNSKNYQENVNDSILGALKLINNEKELQSIKNIMEGALDKVSYYH